MSATTCIAVVGATGAGPARSLCERGFTDVARIRVRSLGGHDRRGFDDRRSDARAPRGGDFDVCLFSVGTAASREPRPADRRGGRAVRGQVLRLPPRRGIPLVVPEVNEDRALEHHGIAANPELLPIPLARPRAAARRRRPAASACRRTSRPPAPERRRSSPRAERLDDHDSPMDWSFDGVEFDEETKIRARAQDPRAPERRFRHLRPHADSLGSWYAEAGRIETDKPVSPGRTPGILGAADGIRYRGNSLPRQGCRR